MSSETWDNLCFLVKTWWQNWPARQWVNDNPRIVLRIAGASFGLFLLVVIWVMWPSGEGAYHRPDKAWYYDTNEDRLFVADADQGSPIDTPSGKKAGFRARVLTYIAEPNEYEQFIGFLEKTDANAPVSKDSRPRVSVRRVDDPNWYAADSVQGRNIVQSALVPDGRGMLPHLVAPVEKQKPRRRRGSN